MSYCDATGAQVDPDNLTPTPADDDQLTVDDMRAICSAVMHDHRLAEDEQLRLVFAVLELAQEVQA